MSESPESSSSTPEPGELPTSLPFPPLTHQHILNCSFSSWYKKYRTSVPKTRVVPLTPAFVSYLREDGIFLPRDEAENNAWSDDEEYDSGIYSETDTEEAAAEAASVANDPATRFRDVHESIKSTIAELGGRVFPKLNWSAPKDAAWISPTNTLCCMTPGDIYLLLKSSDFITHDLEHAFDDCVPPVPSTATIQYDLVLRKWFDINPSVEFRCFVRERRVIGITQRDLNHYDFLHGMREELLDVILHFFDDKLKDTFPDAEFVFDIYIPRTQSKAWLMDINPWAQRTDPVLFSWLELLTMDMAKVKKPEFRLLNKDDPEAYSFNTPQYSAHKLPKEVVDAGMGGAGSIQEFAERWKDIVKNMGDI